MPKKSSGETRPRLPLIAEDININFCRNPQCAHFGQPDDPGIVPPKGRRKKGAASVTRYRIQGEAKIQASLLCLKCRRTTRIKSNVGVAEERLRLAEYLWPDPGPSCPQEHCENHGRGVYLAPDLYRRHGRTRHGSQRYRCRSCGATLSVGKSTLRQKRSHENRNIMMLLTNGMAMRRAAKVAGVAPQTIYDKLTFLHRQCHRFVGHREWRLTRMALPEMFLCSDKQDYYTNWVDRNERTNTRLRAVGTSDLESGYVFGMSLNYVHELVLDEIEARTQELGQWGWPAPYRRYGHYWLRDDLEESKHRPRSEGWPGRSPEQKAAYTMRDAEQRGREEFIEAHRGLPSRGVQVRQEYTIFGHYHLIAGLLHNAPHITLYLDQDSDLRSGALVTFQARIRARKADVFFVKIEKGFTNAKKEALARKGFKHLRALRIQRPGLDDHELRLTVMQRRIERRVGRIVHPYNDLWIRYPFPRKNEPMKAVCHLTEFDDVPIERQAELHLAASLHSIDRFFMQVRRSLSLLERPISSAANAERIWSGKNPYNPHVIQKLLEMYRVVFNYVEVGEDGRTPAMRLGLAKGPVRPEDIIYFNGP